MSSAGVIRCPPMSIAHVCPGGGADLARTRPRIEPVYGLPLVRCGRCERPSVRMTHPLVRRWRELRAAAVALSWLAMKIVMAMFLWILSLYAAKSVTDPLPWERADAWWSVREALGVCIAAAVGHGAWITAGLSHHSRRTAWLGWAGFLYGATAVMVVLFGIVLTPSAADRLDSLGDGAFTAFVITLLLVAAPIGVPLGHWLLRMGRAGRRGHLRRTRARRRGKGAWA